jgi:hypothetical protein
MKNTGWICPKCGRVYAPFVMECSNCNNNEIKPDPCIITPPWSQDYSKYKSEVTTDTYKCGQNVTINDEYLKYTTSRDFNSEYITHTHSSQEQLQESINELNTELENLGAQPTNLDELNNIKNTLKRDSNDDMWPTEQAVKAHLKYIKEQTEAEKNIIDDDVSYWKCSRCSKIHLVFPLSGCECGAPLEYLTYVV